MRFGISQVLFALVATTASVQAASAQQVGAQEPPPAGSSATREQNVSQINGQLVPVGTHNEYYYDFKRWSVSTNPIGDIMGIYSLQLSYGLTENIALRGDVTYYNPVSESDDNDDGFEMTVGVPLYLRRTYQGAFVEGGLMYRQMTNRDSDGTVTSESTEVGPQVLVGWHHTWDAGFNVSYAFGVGRNFSDSDSDDDGFDDEDPLFVNGYFRVGYAF